MALEGRTSLAGFSWSELDILIEDIPFIATVDPKKIYQSITRYVIVKQMLFDNDKFLGDPVEAIALCTKQTLTLSGEVGSMPARLLLRAGRDGTLANISAVNDSVADSSLLAQRDVFMTKVDRWCRSCVAIGVALNSKRVIVESLFAVPMEPAVLWP